MAKRDNPAGSYVHFLLNLSKNLIVKCGIKFAARGIAAKSALADLGY